MAEATVGSVKADISGALETYVAELKLAGEHWDLRPATAAEGEEAWSARQVGEHIVRAGSFFGVGVATAVGLPAQQMQAPELPSAVEALAATEAAHNALLETVAQLKDAQLAIEIDHPRMGKQTVGGILALVANHLKDHANQLKTLRDG